MKNRKTRTTIEVRQVYVIRQPDALARALCRACATGDALMVAPEEAALVAEVPVRLVNRMVEAGAVHYLEAEDGSLLVCLNSMAMTGNSDGFG